ncbi:carbamoylphosphate synthase large subunit [Truncatella angustata]|uniref:Carbamoylphosphate synthase large subunit n=1 Tax=Truncatella angustata TaxID=152316 RepID=A0A9P8UZH5_9PEZI|nr:carbamoylphosphate synthase large subunit [Truncatella angustata]KAH6660831.1 carbamoylphosphate synthase large subunit [Truncatella angustata]KAH8196899.1 hypothetical protein TruAng_008924 [Truncatella angustata]
MRRTVFSDTIRSFGLVITSIFLLPLSLALTSFAILMRRWSSHTRKQQPVPLDPRHKRNILVTGVGMAKGLTLARAFHLSGHNVTGADFEGNGILCSGKYSKSLCGFRPMNRPDSENATRSYIQQLLTIVRDNHIDLWVSCSGVASALEDAKAKELIERKTSCKCIQLGVQDTATLHEKDQFMSEAARLGLPVPVTHHLSSYDEAIDHLSHSQSAHPERKFILKTVGMDDANRGNMTVLPLDTMEKTKTYMSRLPITPENTWILQEFIPGGEEYCTHALIVRGQVKVFVACPSAELLMHYEALPPSSALSRAMLAFTREYVYRSESSEQFTGHLSFDFMVKDSVVDEKSFERSIYAIECNPRAHTAVVLFAQEGPEMASMVQAYLSTLDVGHVSYAEVVKKNGLKEDEIVYPPNAPISRYWIGHDLFSLVVQPTFDWTSGQITLHELSRCFLQFINHALTWKEGTFETWDPLPALALYHVYWPLTILSAWWSGHQWSRVNVSTTKMFAC